MTPSPSPQCTHHFGQAKPDSMALSARDIQRVCLVSPSPLAAPPCPPPPRVPGHAPGWPALLASLVDCRGHLHILTRKNQIRLPSPSLPVLVHSNRNQRAPKPPNRRAPTPAITSSRCSLRPFGSSPLHLRHALASPRLASSRVRLGPYTVIDPFQPARSTRPGQPARRCWDSH